MSDETNIYLSVVLPLFNEEENIPTLNSELQEACSNLGKSYEIIYIDDGSTDKSLEILSHLQMADPHIVVISFRRNFGQTAAISAGFDYARGEIIVSMDADLQNDPHDIPNFLEKIEKGYDVVTGWRHDRKDKFITRRLPSMLANKIISYTTGVRLHDYGCTLKAFRREVVKNIRLYGEMHRFIPAIASGMGISIAEIKVNHRPRKFGTSKYGIGRTFKVILDLVTVKFLLSYATRPIQVFGLTGMACGGIAILITLMMIIQRQFYQQPMGDRPLLLLAILLIFIGIQFVTIGLLAEIQVRTYHESQDKPIYHVKKLLGGQKTA